MNSEYIRKIQALWQDVVEGKKKEDEEKLDPVNKKALSKDFDDRKDKDIDNDGDTDSSDEYLHKRRKAVSKAMKDESADLDTKSVDKALSHDCAKHVTSEQWGFGECISGQHTLVENKDGTATVTHYDVMFEHGVEFDVPVEKLDILVSESHKHTAKKVKEGKTYADRTKGASKAETMKDKLKGKAALDMAKDADMDNPELAADDAKGHEDATKAGRAVKGQAPLRPGEKRMGDTKIVKPVKGAVTSTTGKEG